MGMDWFLESDEFGSPCQILSLDIVQCPNKNALRCITFFADRHILCVREAARLESIGDGQGFVKCSCKTGFAIKTCECV
jgi:hypothetical protein